MPAHGTKHLSASLLSAGGRQGPIDLKPVQNLRKEWSITMQYLMIGIVSLLSGITASLGLGGGFVLVIYLTAIANMQQIEAQGLNLVFFVPIAVLSLILHGKNKLLDKKPLLPAILGGAAGVGIGFGIGSLIGSEWLSKLFAIFILLVGVKELFHKKGQTKQKKENNANG